MTQRIGRLAAEYYSTSLVYPAVQLNRCVRNAARAAHMMKSVRCQEQMTRFGGLTKGGKEREKNQERSYLVLCRRRRKSHH